MSGKVYSGMHLDISAHRIAPYPKGACHVNLVQIQRRNAGHAGRHLACTLGKRLQLVVTLSLEFCQGEQLVYSARHRLGESLRLHSKSRTVDVVVPFLKLVKDGKGVVQLALKVFLADIQHCATLFQLLFPQSLYTYDIKQENIVQHKSNKAENEQFPDFKNKFPYLWIRYAVIEFRQ